MTTIDQPRKEIAQKVVELFLRRLRNPLDEDYKKIVIDVKLIIRESCGWNKRNQKGTEFLAEAVYEGSMKSLLEGFF